MMVPQTPRAEEHLWTHCLSLGVLHVYRLLCVLRFLRTRATHKQIFVSRFRATKSGPDVLSYGIVPSDHHCGQRFPLDYTLCALSASCMAFSHCEASAPSARSSVGSK